MAIVPTTAPAPALRERGSELRRLVARNFKKVVQGDDDARAHALRAFAFLLTRRVTPLVGVEQDGVRYAISTREPWGLGFSTFVYRVFDEQTICRLEAALGRHTGIETLEGLTIVEVGANIGTGTVSMLIRHGAKRIVAIEPDPENVRFLKANLALNGVEDRVDIHQIALSDSDGVLTLERSSDNSGDHRIRVPTPHGPDLAGEQQRVVIDVPARRLDSLVHAGELDADGVGLVWMDAQGHEAHILAGADTLWAAKMPILTEYWPYGLRRVGALDRFHELVAQRCETVVDLRSCYDEPPTVLEASRVAELAGRYRASRDREEDVPYTDLLLLPRRV